MYKLHRWGSEILTTGEKISFERKRLGLSQEELACNVNVARQTVSSWERDVALPDSIYLIPLSKIFSCSIDDLLNPTPPSAAEPGAEARGTA